MEGPEERNDNISVEGRNQTFEDSPPTSPVPTEEELRSDSSSSSGIKINRIRKKRKNMGTCRCRCLCRCCKFCRLLNAAKATFSDSQVRLFFQGLTNCYKRS